MKKKEENTTRIHSFRADIALQYGVPAAILLSHIYFWVRRLRQKKDLKKYADGCYWTYGSRSYFQSCYPYFSGSTLSKYLNLLEKEGLINSSKLYNAYKYDRTKWYTLTQTGWSLCDVNSDNEYDFTDKQCIATDKQSIAIDEQTSATDKQSIAIDNQPIPNLSPTLSPIISPISSSYDDDNIIKLYKTLIDPNISSRDIININNIVSKYGYETTVKAIQLTKKYGGHTTQYLAKVANTVANQHNNNIRDNAQLLLDMIASEDKNNE